MAIFSDVKNKITGNLELPKNEDYVKSRNNKLKDKIVTLELIKKSSDISKVDNPYIKYMSQLPASSENNRLKYKPNIKQLESATILSVKDGNAQLYNANTFSNTINRILKNIKNEVVIGFEISQGDLEIGEINFSDKNLKILPTNGIFKELFENYLLYDTVGIAIDITNGIVKFNFLPPHRYIKKENEVAIFTYKNGSMSTEKRVFNENGSIINGEVTGQFKNGLFYEISRGESLFFNELENILAYDLVNSNIEKTNELSKGKMAIDNKMWGNNPINTEIITLVDKPSGTFGDSTEKMNSYFQSIASNISMNDIILAKQEKEKSLVSGFGLSKKALGLEMGGQDYATSLKFENDMNAKSINSFRRELESVINYLFEEITGIAYKITFGLYKLESIESIIESNAKAISSFQMSISQSQSNLYDNEEKILSETIKIKIENNKTLTFEEEIKAGELGLMPPLIDENDDIQSIINEV